MMSGMRRNDESTAGAVPVAGAWKLETNDGIGTLTLDVPGEKVNVLSTPVMRELDEILRSLQAGADLRCLVVRSAKSGTFIAGADLSEIASIADETSAKAKSSSGEEVLNRLDDLPFPTIAVVDGTALGGGLEIALTCDYRIVTDHPKTTLGLPECSLGIIPGFGGTYRLPRLVGLVQALPLILTGKPVDGKKAFRIHLADAYVPSAFVEDRTREFIDTISTIAGRRALLRRRRRPLPVLLLERTPVGRYLLFRRARQDVLRKTGGNYPAPIAAIGVLKRTVHRSRRRSLEIECAAFSLLAPTQESKNLVDLFFAQQHAKKQAALRAAAGGPPRRTQQAAVLGAGVMGGRIAWLFTKSDIPVVMKDIAWDAVQKGYDSALQVYRELQKRRRYDEREVNLKMHHLHGVLDYRSVGKPDVVVEAVVENIGVKKQVLSEVEKQVGERALIVSNTSSLSIEEMASSLEHPERFAGMHFFNPPNRMPLVEVIAGRRTSPDAVRDTALLASALGKTPVVVQDCPGFLVNRLLMPYLNEAVHLLDEGVDYTRVDRLIRQFGMPMGPFRLLDEIGIDIGYEVAETLKAAYGERMETARFFDALKERSELLGVKSGRGFYLHTPSNGLGHEPAPNPQMRDLIRKHVHIGSRGAESDFDIVHRPVMSMINEAARALEEKIVEGPADVDLALVLGTGFPPFRGGLLRYADHLGIKAVHDTLSRYAGLQGPRFAPAPLVKKLAFDGGRFYAG